MKKIYFLISALLPFYGLTQTPYPNNPSSGLKCWLKADAGVSGTAPMWQWDDQSGAGITGNFQPPLFDLCPPDFATNMYNYNSSVIFDINNNSWNFCGAQGLYSLNTFSGNALFDPLENSIFMVKETKLGLVEMKWEDNFTGVAYRFGVELGGTGNQRFDFVNQTTGQVSGSSTNIQNVFHMGEYTTDANTLSQYINGKLDYSMPNPGLIFNPPASNLCGLSVGSNPPNYPLWAMVNISELMIFNKKLSASENRMVESYLAIKYGLTLGNNQFNAASLNYMASDNTLVWDNHNGYHNHVIGIGRDDASTLNQLKSKGESSFNGTVDMIKIANGNFTTPSSFSNDLEYIVTGSNLGSLSNPIFQTFTHANPLTTLYARLSRSWSIQKTGNPAGNLIIEFDMSLLSGPNANSSIRLMMDDDANFTNGSAGEGTYSPLAGYSAAGGLLYFSIPYSAIPAKGYFTIGSIDLSNAPLPIRIKNFNASCNNNLKTISWTTTSETDCKYFVLSRSVDGINYSTLKTFECNASSHDNYYSCVDSVFNSEWQTTYYKIGYVEGNSGPKYQFTSVVKNCVEDPQKMTITSAYFSDNKINTRVEIPESSYYLVELVDISGKILYSHQQWFEKGSCFTEIKDKELSEGIFLLRILNSTNYCMRKIAVKR